MHFDLINSNIGRKTSKQAASKVGTSSLASVVFSPSDLNTIRFTYPGSNYEGGHLAAFCYLTPLPCVAECSPNGAELNSTVYAALAWPGVASRTLSRRVHGFCRLGLAVSEGGSLLSSRQAP